MGTGLAMILMGCLGGGDTGGGGGSGGSGGSGGHSGSSTAAGDVTWTLLYNTVFGPNGTSSCSTGGACHTNMQSGLKCGTAKSTCYQGLVASGLVTPGEDASSSLLVDPKKSPLCGELGGNMPKVGKCVSEAQLNRIHAWLSAGAPEN